MAEFFTSYARADSKNNPDLKEFVEALREEIRTRTGKSEDEVAFFDVTDIKTGTQWREVLGDAVAGSRVCVCLCSPTYYNSEFCGKELEVFRQRVKRWKSLRRVPAKDVPPFIVPVIWQPKANGVPKVIMDAQLDDDLFPADYKTMGLRQLIQRKRRGPTYYRVVQTLGKIIEDALGANPALPRYDAPIDFNAIENVLAEARTPHAVYGVVLSAVSTWQPFQNGATVERLVEPLISGMGKRFLGFLAAANLGTALDLAEQSRQIVLVFVNPADAAAPALAPMLRDLCSHRRSSVAIMACWSSDLAALGEEARGQIEVEIRRRLAVYSDDGSGFHDFSSLRSPELFARRVEETYTKVWMYLMTGQPANKAEDEAVIRQAAAEGRNISVLSTLHGPGGQV